MKKLTLRLISAVLAAFLLASAVSATDVMLLAQEGVAADAVYDVYGKYDAQTGVFTASVYFTCPTKLDLASFAFWANPSKMTFSGITYAENIRVLSEDELGYFKNENGVIADQWYMLGGADASSGIKVCDITYTMTNAAYKTFNPQSDFMYSHDTELNEYTSDGNVHFYVLHTASFEIEKKGITMNVPTDTSAVNVSVTYDNTKCQPVFDKISAPLKDITFSVNTFSGEQISSVTYRTSSDNTENVLTEVNGIYTIPGDKVVSDVYITINHVSFETGDINGDRFINIADVTRLLKYCVDQNTVIATAASDVNGDSLINSADAAALLKMLIK